MPGTYTLENIQTVKDLAAVYKTLAEERSKLSLVLELKRAELMTNSERTSTKLITNPETGLSSWVLDPTKKGDIREPAASANLEAMNVEWEKAIQTLKLLDRSLLEQTNRLANMADTTKDAGLTATEKPFPALIEEANRCASAIEEFKDIYAKAWGTPELEAKHQLSSTKEGSQEAKRTKAEIAEEANMRLKAWESSPEALVMKAKEEQAKKERAEKIRQKARERIQEEERKKAFEKAFEEHNDARAAKIASQAQIERERREAFAKVRSTVYEHPDAKILDDFKSAINTYIHKKLIFGRKPPHIQDAGFIHNYMEVHKPTEITQELMRHIETYTPKEGELKEIITSFIHNAKAVGYEPETKEALKKKT